MKWDAHALSPTLKFEENSPSPPHIVLPIPTIKYGRVEVVFGK